MKPLTAKIDDGLFHCRRCGLLSVYELATDGYCNQCWPDVKKFREDSQSKDQVFEKIGKVKPKVRTLRFVTKIGYVAHVDMWKWDMTDFMYLGVIWISDQPAPWAWRADGRSIDKDDRGFDLIDFPTIGGLDGW